MEDDAASVLAELLRSVVDDAVCEARVLVLELDVAVAVSSELRVASATAAPITMSAMTIASAMGQTDRFLGEGGGPHVAVAGPIG
jgi:hypothetical protein